MGGSIVCALVGVVCIVLGISNVKGNISSLHEYHRSRVKEEDRLPFGRLVGLGTILAGVGVLLYSGCLALCVYKDAPVWNTVGMVLLFALLGVGMGIAFFAMKKYNKGIF